MRTLVRLIIQQLGMLVLGRTMVVLIILTIARIVFSLITVLVLLLIRRILVRIILLVLMGAHIVSGQG